MSASALLLVMMEPPASLDEEFNDWYDTEHFPQRAALPGFLVGSRWACVDGWPKWAATYDLSSMDALQTPDYVAVSGANSTPWSKRVLGRTIGRQRIIADALPSPVDLADTGGQAVTRLLITCFSCNEANTPSALLDAAHAHALKREDVLRVRGFMEQTASSERFWLTVMFSAPVSAASLHANFGKLENAGATLFNLYVPYIRG